MRHNAFTANSAIAIAAAFAAALTACSSMPASRTREPPAPVVDRNALQGAAVVGYLDMRQRLVQGGAAEQAEIFAAAKRMYDDAPTPTNELRYALALCTQGHAGYDLSLAQKLLRELVATPEALLPAERSLTLLELQNVDRALLLAADVKRLQSAIDRLERDRSSASNRRLQAEVEENARLRKALEEAQAKLDAIANIERSITERKAPNEGRRK